MDASPTTPATALNQDQQHSHSLFPASANRVPAHTDPAIQKRIRKATVNNIAQTISAPNRIEIRLAELDREWDTERILELNASLFALSGVLLGKFVNRKWFFLSIAVTGFLAQHALQGWCPPLAVLRHWGVRTRKEIEQERNALKTARGDFQHVPENTDLSERAEALLQLQEKQPTGKRN